MDRLKGYIFRLLRRLPLLVPFPLYAYTLYVSALRYQLSGLSNSNRERQGTDSLHDLHATRPRVVDLVLFLLPSASFSSRVFRFLPPSPYLYSRAQGVPLRLDLSLAL